MALSDRLGAPVVLGTLSQDPMGRIRNSVVSVFGGSVDRIDKNKRVPWAESGFAAGESVRPISAGPHILSAVVCFEAAFGGLTRALVEAGGGPILNLTSDAWFPPTGVGSWGRLQQFAHLPLRAVENRTPVLRVANRGPSAWIDPYGRVRWTSQEAGVDVVTVRAGPGRSLFGRTGDLLGPVALLVSLFALLRRTVEPESPQTLY